MDMQGIRVLVYNEDGSWAAVEPLLIVSIDYPAPSLNNGPANPTNT